MRAIIHELKTPTTKGALRRHDLVAMQEMWSPATYEHYREELRLIYPYSHYWRSGPLGSGLALFSVHPIEEVAYMSYALNGHPGKIFDGDWFANKGVGHARLRLTSTGTTVDVFTTHLIANYAASAGHDRYAVHRMTQLYELLRFAQSYRDPRGAGALILGDLNMELGTWAWRALVSNQKTFLSVYEGLAADQMPCTCNCPLNAYSKAQETPSTIDHVLYTPEKLIMLDVRLAFTGELSPASKKSYKSYSDHFGVASTFRLNATGTGLIPPPKRDPQSMRQAIERIQTVELSQLHLARRTSLRNVILLSTALMLSLIFATVCAIRGQVRGHAPRGYQPIPSDGSATDNGCNPVVVQAEVRTLTLPIIIPGWAPVLAITLVPLTCLALGFHLLLYAFHYPLEIARISEFVLEFKYWLSRLHA